MTHQTAMRKLLAYRNELVYCFPFSLLQHTEMSSLLKPYHLVFSNNNAETAHARCQPMRKQEETYHEFTAEIIDTAGKWSEGFL